MTVTSSSGIVRAAVRGLALALGMVSGIPPQPGPCATTVASRADRAFVATVLQGGTFEVEAGKHAAAKAAAIKQTPSAETTK